MAPLSSGGSGGVQATELVPQYGVRKTPKLWRLLLVDCYGEYLRGTMVENKLIVTSNHK